MRKAPHLARRPAVGLHWLPARRLMKSRGRRFWLRANIMPQIQIATQPRRRTLFARPADELRDLSKWRNVGRRMRKLGARRVRPGLWYYSRADVHYAAASWAPAGGLE